MRTVLVSTIFRYHDRPWRIRTDPKERGFAYLSGVKRQAGQVQRNLLTHDGVPVDEDGKNSKNGTPTTTAAAAHTSSSLERLETARVSQSIVQTDREELAALKTLNRNSAGNEGQDVEHNAWIRTGFRQERKDYRTQLQGATTLGWKPGMILLPKNYETTTNTNYLQDVLVSKEVCYGKPASTTERTQFQTVRQSSIFATTTTANSRKHRLSRRRKAKQRKHEQAQEQELLLASSNNSNNNNNNNNTRSPDIVKSSVTSKQHPHGIVKREENCDVNFPPMSTVSPPKPTTYDDDATSSSLRSEHIIPVTVVSSSSNNNNNNNTSRLVTTTTTNMSSASLSSVMPMKKILKLSHHGRGIVSIATVTTINQNKDDNNNNVNHDAPTSLVLSSSSSSSSKEGNIVKESFDKITKTNPEKFNTLLELVGGYGTSSDEDE